MGLEIELKEPNAAYGLTMRLACDVVRHGIFAPGKPNDPRRAQLPPGLYLERTKFNKDGSFRFLNRTIPMLPPPPVYPSANNIEAIDTTGHGFIAVSASPENSRHHSVTITQPEQQLKVESKTLDLKFVRPFGLFTCSVLVDAWDVVWPETGNLECAIDTGLVYSWVHSTQNAGHNRGRRVDVAKIKDMRYIDGKPMWKSTKSSGTLPLQSDGQQVFYDRSSVDLHMVSGPFMFRGIEDDVIISLLEHQFGLSLAGDDIMNSRIWMDGIIGLGPMTSTRNLHLAANGFMTIPESLANNRFIEEASFVMLCKAIHVTTSAPVLYFGAASNFQRIKDWTRSPWLSMCPGWSNSWTLCLRQITFKSPNGRKISWPEDPIPSISPQALQFDTGSTYSYIPSALFTQLIDLYGLTEVVDPELGDSIYHEQNNTHDDMKVSFEVYVNPSKGNSITTFGGTGRTIVALAKDPTQKAFGLRGWHRKHVLLGSTFYGFFAVDHSMEKSKMRLFRQPSTIPKPGQTFLYSD